jgi:hypothetical protein
MNSGVFSIYDVRFFCEIKDVEAASGGYHAHIENSKFSWLDVSKEIQRGESDTTTCPALGWPGATAIADIRIGVSFRPSFWPTHVEKKFRFTGTFEPGRAPFWLPAPIGK